jgi:hypothetical protein
MQGILSDHESVLAMMKDWGEETERMIGVSSVRFADALLLALQQKGASDE